MASRIFVLLSSFLLSCAAVGVMAAGPSNDDGSQAVKDINAQSAELNPSAQPIDPNEEKLSSLKSTDEDNALQTLRSLISLKDQLQAEMKLLSARLQESQSDIEKKETQEQTEKLNQDIKATTRNIQEIAAGADISSLRSREQPAFNFQEELFSLLEPAMKEMKDMTSHVRQKTEQRDRKQYYSSKLPTTKRAIASLESLLLKAEDPALKSTLQSMLEAWVKQGTFLNSEIASASYQLEKLERAEVSLTESSQTFFKSFFQKRGLYLGQAILVIFVILLLSRFSHKAMQHNIPGFQKAQRSFRVRLLDLAHKVLFSLFVIIGPMVVFYLAEDWLLFSLGVLVLLGMAITLRHAIPRYWELAQLFLNIGTVREGERIEMNGLPWLVQKINFYTLLQNPKAGLTRRVKIDDLVEIRSRETKDHEAWFPCKTGDWLLFDDESLAKVIGISEEFTELVLRGGAHKTYKTSDFLDCAPKCLSQNFRVKETIGVSYALQAESVSSICDELHDHVMKRLADEGYIKYLMNLSVEFELANASSLDLVVIADYKGDLAHAHNRLRRSTQRWCVEACTEHGWEIPFMQVTLHQPAQ